MPGGIELILRTFGKRLITLTDYITQHQPSSNVISTGMLYT